MELHIYIYRISIALALGFLIGVERQWRQRNAGIRTYSLVSLGSAMFVLLSLLIGEDADMSRIPAQIVSGIGFIGAGVIFKGGQSVSGLNTAASIWATAAVGSLAGFGYIPHAIIGAAMALSINTVLRRTYRFFEPQRTAEERSCKITILCAADDEHHIRSVLHAMLATEGIQLYALASEDSDRPDTVLIEAESRLVATQLQNIERIVSRISLEKTIRSVRWETIPENT